MLENAILTPEPRRCVFDALPLPPSTIDDIDIVSQSVGEDTPGTLVLALTLDWSRPSGSIDRFELRVLEEATLEDNVDGIFMSQFPVSFAKYTVIT